jgi:hypothetical protein
MRARFLRAAVSSLCAIFVMSSLSLLAQDKLPPRPLVTAEIDTSQREELPGTLSPLAVAKTDHGSIDAALPLGRMMLLLNRPAERSTALEAFLANAQTPGSADFHHWLTPQEFGQRFGPSDSDVAAVSAWLQSQGLHIEAVSRGRQVIQFSGTASQFNSAFSTHLDRFEVNGVTHILNATPLHVPAALHDSIAAVSPIGTPSRSSSLTRSGRADFHAGTHPQWTQAGGTTPVYSLAPADLAMQYDLAPLYAAGTNGAGQTIGVIGESNINAAEVATFRSIFGIAPSPVQVIVDGADPGVLDNPTEFYRDVNDDPTVSYLGVETAGGLAPGAQIRLYVSGGSDYQDPLLLAAQRAVDDNQADVLSLGYSECETFLDGGNTLYAALWEQAAAQGQTVVVASGYWGSAGCFSDFGLGAQPNGMGSTPWNLSVGGTDFFYSDYATGGASAGGLWNSTNDPTTKASLKGSLPEQTWNDEVGLNAVPFSLYFTRPWAAGGAPSTCGIVDVPPGDPFGTCVSGWPKPAWQNATGVPQDGVRDTPDVSLFAGDGENFSAYAICEFAQDCVPDANGNFSADIVGGTSAAAPAMAAIMALVDQKYGRQGQAATVLYALAKLAPSVFHDITHGGNQTECNVGAVPDCVAGTNGTGVTPGYQAAAGYDLASGLGSIDAAQLIHHWADGTTKSSTTTLQLTPLTFQHGQSATVSVKVAGSDDGTPTGDVALLSTSPEPAQESQGVIALQGGVGSEALATLPGGTYQLTGRYGGDGSYAPSTSTPVSVTITPETSAINFEALPTGHWFGSDLGPNQVAFYGEPVQFIAHPTGVSGDGGATGTATFTVNTATFAAALNAGGYAIWTPQALPVGAVTASATYGGDASFAASTSTTVSYNVIQGIPDLGAETNALYGTVHQGDPITVGITAGSQQLAAPGTLPPTGEVEAALGGCNPYSFNPVYQQEGTLSVPLGTSDTVSSALVTIPNVAAGSYCLWVLYAGDANWSSTGTVFVPGFAVVAVAGIPTTTSLQITPTTIIAGQTTAMTATVSAPAGSSIAPTGSVVFYDNGSDGNGTYSFSGTLSPGPNGSSIAALTEIPASHFFNSGVNQMIATYYGDSIYSPSQSAVVDITATQPAGGDFKLEASQTQISLAAGKASSVSLNLTALQGFTGTVNLVCTPSTAAATCSISPASIALSNFSTATLSFNAYTTTSGLTHGPGDRTALAALGGCLMLFGLLRRRRWYRLPLGALSLIVAITAGGCGGNNATGNKGGGTTIDPTTPGPYTIGVTATSGMITHQVTVLVNIQ